MLKTKHFWSQEIYPTIIFDRAPTSKSCAGIFVNVQDTFYMNTNNPFSQVEALIKVHEEIEAKEEAAKKAKEKTPSK